MKLTGKNIVITGAASGIGRAMARRFRLEGAASIMIADINQAALEDVAKEVGAIPIATDVSKEQDIKDLITAAETEFGQIDLLCNNAGIGLGGGPETTDENWQKIWEINVMAHIWACRAALPGMLARQDGYILNTASAAGLLSQVGSAPYAVTKHAAVAFSEWLAISYGDRGLKVSVLCPQAVRTAMTAGSGGGVASVNGMIEPEALCDTVIESLDIEEFLVLPHPEVKTYMQRKSQDYDRWLKGMRRLHAQYGSDNWP
ncbi:MAG: SDR family oxidoreductase [Gammaproteobacteria bacterium]|jgi:NAD(P)-dependent dehydrogenase (short-subunit alcohol dehydrogenase family)|nr:SDR family oxidoreductase [Gammaproteobacteria bacterium]MBT5201876.1 SDR family oxidoreductase [Gammaproteobacteria bacterium]MBT5604104.1 SDR family oxidoreductase [Gammaproteobacteria bacterium]MBT6246484.1 SDR family oxidoreductase [Gammaproteobacteria bacterium]